MALPQDLPRVGILSTFGHSTNSASFLERLVVVESSLAAVLHVIAPDRDWEDRSNVVFHRVRYEVGKNPLGQIVNQAIAQVRMSFRLAGLIRKVDYWIFYGGDVLLLPAITGRLLGRRIVVALAGNLEREAQLKKNALNRFQIVMRRAVFALSDRILLFSESLTSQWHLERYRPKTMVADSHFLELTVFRIERPLDQRDLAIGYIGRLSEEKGVLNLAEAIPLVLQQEPRARFLIVGDGPLHDRMRAYVEDRNLQGRVTMVDRVPGKAVPRYLNELKLCVLPSYTEGMPNIVLEAMACGAPVLATPVGAIPDLIQDGRTGFLMEGNSPECIASNIIRAIRCDDLAEVVDSARRLVERRFTLAAAVESFRRVTPQWRAALPPRADQ